MSTAIYARISDDRQEGAGVERQLQDCRALVKRKGWQPVVEFKDNDVSAFSGKLRPDYEAMLAKVKAGEFDRIVVWHIQSRSLFESAVTHFHNGRSTSGLIASQLSTESRRQRLRHCFRLPRAIVRSITTPPAALSAPAPGPRACPAAAPPSGENSSAPR